MGLRERLRKAGVNVDGVPQETAAGGGSIGSNIGSAAGAPATTAAADVAGPLPPATQGGSSVRERVERARAQRAANAVRVDPEQLSQLHKPAQHEYYILGDRRIAIPAQAASVQEDEGVAASTAVAAAAGASPHQPAVCAAGRSVATIDEGLDDFSPRHDAAVAAGLQKQQQQQRKRKSPTPAGAAAIKSPAVLAREKAAAAAWLEDGAAAAAAQEGEEGEPANKRRAPARTPGSGSKRLGRATKRGGGAAAGAAGVAGAAATKSRRRAKPAGPRSPRRGTVASDEGEGEQGLQQERAAEEGEQQKSEEGRAEGGGPGLKTPRGGRGVGGKRSGSPASEAHRVQQSMAGLDEILAAKEEEEGEGLEGDSEGGDLALQPGLPLAAPVPRNARPRAGVDTSNAGQGPDEPLPLCMNMAMELCEVPAEGEGDEDVHLQLEVSAAINKFLREYQKDGVRFLFRHAWFLERMGAPARKTVQVIAFVAAVLGKNGMMPGDDQVPMLRQLEDIEPPPIPEHPGDQASGLYVVEEERFAPNYGSVDYGGTDGVPILIVCPTSVCENWDREFETWGSGGFRVVICHGAKQDAALSAICNGRSEIMIIPYGTLRNNIEEINTIPWHLVIFDEAHNLKNPSTATYKAADSLPTRLRYGLTGTPLQNDYDELWALMSVVAPKCLDDRASFRKDYATPIKMGHRSTASAYEVAQGKHAQCKLRKKLTEYLLRRNKKLISHQMPRKRDMVVYCNLSDLQLATYERVLQLPDLQLLLRYEEPCDCGSNAKRFECCHWKAEDGVLWPMYHVCNCNRPVYDALLQPDGCKWHKPDGCWRVTPFGERRICPFCLVLPICNILRKISNHLELVKPDPADEAKDPVKFERDMEVAHMILGEDAHQVGLRAESNWLRLSSTRTCGKMQALESLLASWAGGTNKVLIFSHSVKMLGIIAAMLEAKGYSHIMLDGSVNMKDRQPLVDQFNSRPSLFVFLISTLAGGVGLNVTSANKVVIFDPSWNPAADLQAQDRAYRIGQRRDVAVYRLVSAGTLEEMVYGRQISKQQHSNLTIEGTAERRYFAGAKTGKKADHGELWGMLNLLKLNVDSIQTKSLVERRCKAEAEQGYQVEELDPELVQAAVEAAGGSQAGGHASDALANSGVDDFDPGLEEILGLDGELLGDGEAGGIGAPSQQQLAATAAIAVAAEGRPAQRRRRGGAGGTAGSSEAPRSPLSATQEQELAVLQQAGVAGALLHDGVLGGSKYEEDYAEAAQAVASQQAQEAAAAMAAAAAAAAGFRSNPGARGAAAAAKQERALAAAGAPVMDALHSLAAFWGVPVALAAERLLGMTAEERADARKDYVQRAASGSVAVRH